MTRLEILNAKIDEARGKVGELVKSRPNKDFQAEELKTLQGLNTDLAAWVTEAESLKSVEQLIAETETYLGKNDFTGEGLPTGGKPVAVKMGNGAVINFRNSKGELLSDAEITANIAEYAKSAVQETSRGDEPGGLWTPSGTKAIADAFVNSKAFTEYSKVGKRSPEAEVELKTLLDTTAFPVASVRSNLLLQYPLRRLVVADLFPSGNISQPRFLYMEETAITNGADFVAEGGQKPESALQFTEQSADVRKIATVLPVTDELFDDVPAMRSYVQGRLTQFLQLAEENALLNGSGTAPALMGVLNNSGIQTQAKGADTIADACYKAATKVEVNSFLPNSGFVLHPNDWQRIRLSKDSNGQYLFGSPLAGDLERLFGYPVVKTVAMTEGTGLAGAFDLAAQIFRRTGISFAVSTEHSDFFIKNKLMLRVEERLAFPIFRPAGFCKLTGLNG